MEIHISVKKTVYTDMFEHTLLCRRGRVNYFLGAVPLLKELLE